MKAQEKIKVWRPEDIAGVELRAGENVADSYPRHWHDEYFLCVIEAGAGELIYRGSHYTPEGSLLMIEPGAVHAHNKPLKEVTFRNLYAEARLLGDAATEIGGCQRAMPVFTQPVIFDKDIVTAYINLHATLEKPSSRLERESLMIDFFVRLIMRCSEDRPSLQKIGREQRAVLRARDFLVENFSRNVSLNRLAKVVDLSPFHLSRVFSREIGMPPHAFQTQLRVTRAKEMLRRGVPISRAAIETGFADQSHLNRHFKRLLQVTPGQYIRNSKNVQDGF